MVAVANRTQGARQLSGSLAFYLALAAVGAAVFSRLFVVWFNLPSALNFVHFAVALVAMLVTRHPLAGAQRQMLRAILAFVALATFSGILNGVEVARVILSTMVWAEPLMITYLVWVAAETGPDRQRAGKTAVAVVIASVSAQFLFMTAQIPAQFALPGGDQMQGTFLRGGTGAHVAPAVALVGVILLLDSAVAMRRHRWAKLLLAAYGLFLAQMALAVGVTLTFAAALAAGVMLFKTGTVLRWLSVAVLAMGIAAVMWFTLPFVKNLPSVEAATLGLQVKIVGVQRLIEEMGRDSAYLIVGQGPGMTLSRVAMQTPEANLNADSPVAMLGFRTTEFTKSILAARSQVLIARSSFFSPATTFVGLLGDLGILGLALYLSMWSPAIKSALRRTLAEDRWGVGVVVLATAFLALINLWLEEPGYVLVFALVVGLAASGELHSAPTGIARRSERVSMRLRADHQSMGVGRAHRLSLN